MKNTVKYLFFSFSILCSFNSNAQTETLQEKLEKNIKPNASYLEIVAEFNKQWKEISNSQSKSSQDEKTYKHFKRWEIFWADRLDENGGFEGALNFNPKLKPSSANGVKSLSEEWTPIGPYGINVSSTELKMDNFAGGIGAVHAVAFDKRDVNTIYAASRGGGLFKTTNGGDYWWNVSDGYTNIYRGFSNIVVDPNNINVLYASLTGGMHGGWAMNRSYYAYGAVTSIDGGLTWSALNSSSSTHPFENDPTNGGKGRYIEELVIHPSNGNLYMLVSENAYAGGTPAEESYILESTAGSDVWTKLYTFPGKMESLKILPSNTNIFYVSGVGGLNQYNISTGVNISLWANLLANLPFTPDRVYVETTNADPNNVYMFATFKNSSYTTSNNHFIKYNHTSASYYLPSTSVTTSFLVAGGNYGIRVSDHDASKIYIYKGWLYASTNGGANFSQINVDNSGVGTSNILHADFRDLAFFPNSDTLVLGNDGGLIFRDQNLSTNKYISGCGLLIAQAYSLWLDERYDNSFLIGLQDNNSAYRDNLGKWSTKHSGDGGMSMISPSGGLSYSNQSSFTSSNLIGSNTYPYTLGINCQRRFHPDFPEEEVIGSGGNGLRIHKNSITPGIAAYEQYSHDFWWRVIPAFDICESYPKISYVYGLYNDYTGQALFKGNNGQSTDWDDWDEPVTLPSISASFKKVTRVLAHPLDTNQVWLTYGGYHSGEKVFHSTDGAQTWTDHSLGLENFPVNSIVMDKNSGYLFIATDLGVYYKHSTASSSVPWMEYGSGLPRVSVSEIRINHTYNKIVAATFGRGVWEAPLECFTGTTNLPSSFHYYYQNEYITGSTNQDANKTAIIRASNKINFYPGFNSAPTIGNILSAKIIPCASNGVTDPCSSYQKFIESQNQDSEEVASFKSNITIYPNPNNGMFTVDLNDISEEVSIEILNSIGELVLSKKINTKNSFEVNLKDETKGIYFVKIKSRNNVKVEKIIYQ